MPYAIAVNPSTIAKDEIAEVTVTLPDVEDAAHDLDLVERATGTVKGRAFVTLHVDQPTVGLEADLATDYFVRSDGAFRLVQTGTRTFTLSYDPSADTES